LADYGAPIRKKLLEPYDAALAERLRAYIYGIVDLVPSKDSTQGCLFVKSSCESGSHAMPEDIAATLRDQAKSAQAHLVSFLQDEQSRGNLTTEADAKHLAKYLTSIMYGLGGQAKNGSTRRSLRSVVDLAISVVPVID